jgi:hypothetical protein
MLVQCKLDRVNFVMFVEPCGNYDTPQFVTKRTHAVVFCAGAELTLHSIMNFGQYRGMLICAARGRLLYFVAFVTALRSLLPRFSD